MFCRNCGKKLEEDARFCSGCGCSVSDAVVSMQPKVLHVGIKAGIIIVVGAVVLCFCLFVFTSMKGGDEAGASRTDGLKANGAIEGGSCDSYTIGETSAVSQWVLENWGVDGIGQCDFIEFMDWNYEMQLVVKRPGINLDYAVFLLDDGDSDVGILGKYVYSQQVSGIYCGTDGEGLDFYRMYIVTLGIDWGVCAINENSKIESIFFRGFFYNVSYGENGKQEGIKSGRLTTDEKMLLEGICVGQMSSQFYFLFDNVYGTFKYKYDPVTNRIEEVHVELYKEGVDQNMRDNPSIIKAECTFRYLELADRVSLEGVICRIPLQIEEAYSTGEGIVHNVYTGERTAWINYNRDASGNLISFEIGHD